MKKSVGQILSKARERQDLSLEYLARITKIKVEQLQALEEDAYHRLPPPAYIQGFIKNLASVLRLDESEVLALFRRDYREVDTGQQVKTLGSIPRSNLLTMTPQKLSLLSGLGVFALIGVYLGMNLLAKPQLTVKQPQDRAIVQATEVVVSGQTISDASVLINNQKVELKPNGYFEVKLALKPGLNTITIVAAPPFGRENRVTRIIFHPVDEGSVSSYSGRSQDDG